MEFQVLGRISLDRKAKKDPHMRNSGRSSGDEATARNRVRGLPGLLAVIISQLTPKGAGSMVHFRDNIDFLGVSFAGGLGLK
jgi:hypothetical protein